MAIRFATEAKLVLPSRVRSFAVAVTLITPLTALNVPVAGNAFVSPMSVKPLPALLWIKMSPFVEVTVCTLVKLFVVRLMSLSAVTPKLIAIEPALFEVRTLMSCAFDDWSDRTLVPV